MIGYLEGRVFKNDSDGVILLVSGVGYEIFLPEITAKSFSKYNKGDEAGLFIYYHQTERQPVPTLIGFENEQDKVFFKRFISVEDIGVIKAVKALTKPVEDIISAIESEDAKPLMALKGIGKRTAGKIIATLKGKFDDFVLNDVKGYEQEEFIIPKADFIDSVKQVMTTQLGHGIKEAEELIEKALKRNNEINSPEELLEEVYRKGITG